MQYFDFHKAGSEAGIFAEDLGRLQQTLRREFPRDEMMYDILKNVPIPTNRDMDDLYKEFYELKKKVRELSRKLEERE